MPLWSAELRSWPRARRSTAFDGMCSVCSCPNIPPQLLICRALAKAVHGTYQNAHACPCSPSLVQLWLHSRTGPCSSCDCAYRTGTEPYRQWGETPASSTPKTHEFNPRAARSELQSASQEFVPDKTRYFI